MCFSHGWRPPDTDTGLSPVRVIGWFVSCATLSGLVGTFSSVVFLAGLVFRVPKGKILVGGWGFVCAGIPEPGTGQSAHVVGMAWVYVWNRGPGDG